MRINEIFYSIQGEGRHAGCAATFIRLSGCNLNCDFCDTKHQTYKDLSEDEICEEIKENRANLVVVTGGEPSLQLTETLVEKLHVLGKVVAVETNGTRELPSNVDFITISPKEPYVGATGHLRLKRANEVKVVYDGIHLPSDFGIEADYYYVQPCDTGDAKRNTKIIEQCVEFIKENPKWVLSLQTQKIINVR